MTEFTESKEFKSKVKNIKNGINSLGIEPYDDIWVIRWACHKCKKMQDGCGKTCEKRTKRYLEKTKVLKTRAVVEQHQSECNNSFTLEFTDVDGNQYTLDDLNKNVFTSRDSALDAL